MGICSDNFNNASLITEYDRETQIIGIVKKYKLRKFLKICLFLILPMLIAVSSTTFSQVSLTVTKSNNAPNPIPSGQPFTYTIVYSWSGGAPGTLYIVDNVPAGLDVISALPTSPISSIVGNQVTFALSGLTLPSGSGTIQINAMFKPGVTCGGAKICNKAAITTNLNSGTFVWSNDDCVTAAVPTNKWTFEKELVSGCALDDEVVFRIKIINPWGGDIGGLNLTNINLYDIVPPGAIILGIYGNWNGISGTLLTGGPTSIGVSPWYTWYTVYVKLKFPSGPFTVGQTVINKSNITFTTPCSTQPVTWTDTAKVVLCNGIYSGSISKWLSLNMYFPSNPSWYPVFSPGCCGSYTLWYSNNGTLAQSNYVMTDILPTKVDVNTINTSVPTGDTVKVDVYCWSGTSCGTTPCTTVTYTTAGFQSMTGLPANICKITWTYTKPIAVSQTLYNTLNVCVRTTDFSNGSPVLVGQNIVNTLQASATSLPTMTVTHTKVVDVVQPKVITTKMFIGDCNNACQVTPGGPFQPGDTVRFRIAVANIGSANATTCVIKDTLPAGLTYVGNPTYYYNTFNWMAYIYNPPCCSLSVAVPSQIGGTLTTPIAGQTNLQWTFPLLPSRCDGLVEYFMIDFDVKISDSPPAPPGQYVNTFTFSASNVPNTLSNPAYLTVNATAQIQAIKEVKAQGSSSPWSNSASALPGGMAGFRLSVVNTGNTALTNLCLLDIMPFVGDIKVLPAYSPRNSQYDLPYDPTNGLISISPVGFSSTYNTLGLNPSKNPTRTTECGGFCGSTDPIGAVLGNFTGAAAQTYSFKVNANAAINLAPGGTLSVLVPVKTPVGQKPQMSACNSFAVQAKPLGMPSVCLKAESNNACLTIDEPKPCFRFDQIVLNCIGLNSAGGWVYQLQTNLTNLNAQPGNITITSSTGTVTNVSPTFLPSGVPTAITATYNPSSSNPLVCFTIVLTTQNGEKLCDTTICLDAKPCPNPCPCPFTIGIKENHAVQSSGNQIWLNNFISVIGAPVMKVKATLINATVTQVCFNGSSTTYTPAATINWGSWNPITAVGLGTNEVTWTNMLCPDLINKPLALILNIPNAPGKGCYQKVKFCIRYTITDCKCNTCDTVVCFEVIRKWMPIILPGDNKKYDGKNSIDKSDYPDQLAIEPEFASIKMSSETKGTLTINNPAEDETTMGVNLTSIALQPSLGVGIKSFIPNSSDWSSGSLGENGMVSSGLLTPGKSLNFEIEFDNPALFKTWECTLNMMFTINGIEDTLSGATLLRVRTPGVAGGDAVLSDFSENDLIRTAKTYALRLITSNTASDSISKLILRVKDGSVLAVGPQTNDQEVSLSGYREASGEFSLLSSAPDGNVAMISPIPVNRNIGPVFLTLVSKNPQLAVIEFETRNSYDEVVSTGSITFDNPIQGVNGDQNSGSIFLSEAVPNPTNSSTIIKFTLPKDESKVIITIADGHGVVQKKLYDGSLSQGDHEVDFSPYGMSNGIYYYTIQTSNESLTRKVVVLK
jgi:uncharacterized repeat protein (TIGR01451 family)